MRILFFGDSITQGFFDSQGGWTQRLINIYHTESLRNRDQNGRWVECFNLGISGDTAVGLLARLEPELLARQLYTDSNLVVIAIGINDTAKRNSKAVNSPEKYQATIDHIYHTALIHSGRVLFVGLSAVEDRICNPWPYSSNNSCFDNDRIGKFNRQLKNYCQEHHVSFVDVFDRFIKLNQTENLLADGLHPNDAGHQLIAELVKPELEKLLVLNDTRMP